MPKSSHETDLSTRHCSLPLNQTQSLLLDRSFAGEIQDGRKFWRAKSLPECIPRKPDNVCADLKDDSSRFCPLRSFKSTDKGLVRNGEFVTSKDSSAFMFSGSVRCYRQPDAPGPSDSKDSSDSSATWDSLGGSSLAESYYRVAVLGAPKVGKTVLIRRFLAYEDDENRSIDNQEVSSRTLSVLLDGQESLLEFFDDLEEMSLVCPMCSPNTILSSGNDRRAARECSLPQHSAFCDVASRPGDDVDVTGFVSRDTTMTSDASPTWTLSRFDAFLPVQEPVTCDNVACQFDAYMVVFSVDDLLSFQYGCTKVRHLREDLGTDRTIILVGNKADLVRKRCVRAEDAMLLAHKYDCKYTETSALFSHQTDELLVGVLRQISRKLCTAQAQEDDREVTNASRKRFKWRKLSRLRKFLDKAVKTRESCCDILA